MKIPDSEMNDDYEFGDYLDDVDASSSAAQAHTPAHETRTERARRPDVQVREAGEKLTRRKRAKGREAGRGRCGGTGAGSERGGGRARRDADILI